jgi:hypothetical protein
MNYFSIRNNISFNKNFMATTKDPTKIPEMPKPDKTPEIGQPEKTPEIENPHDPETPKIPEEAPDNIPDEDPFENPPPYEVPEPGEGT